MKNIIHISFCAVIGIVLAFSIVKFNGQGDVLSAEKRSIASKPTSITDFQGWDAFFNDRFGYRDQLINLANHIDYDILNKTVKNSKAFKGKDGWFYYIDVADGDNQGDFCKTNLLNADELAIFKADIQENAKWCDDNGIKYLFIICPNKHNVYPEYHILSRPDGITRTDQLLRAFKESGINCIFPLDYLLEKKKTESLPLYYETDTHWNDLGAYYAFEAIKEEIIEMFPDKDFPNIEYKRDVTYSETAGDILPMLNIKEAKSTRISLSPIAGSITDYFVYTKDDEENGVISKGKNDSLPKAVVFRDSFFTAMTQYLSTMFSNVEYNWRRMTEDDKKSILANKPDLIIFESVERHSVTIAKE